MSDLTTPELFDGPFPANVPEAPRWVPPAPNALEADRASSGGLSDSPGELPTANPHVRLNDASRAPGLPRG